MIGIYARRDKKYVNIDFVEDYMYIYYNNGINTKMVHITDNDLRPHFKIEDRIMILSVLVEKKVCSVDDNYATFFNGYKLRY